MNYSFSDVEVFLNDEETYSDIEGSSVRCLTRKQADQLQEYGKVLDWEYAEIISLVVMLKAYRWLQHNKPEVLETLK